MTIRHEPNPEGPDPTLRNSEVPRVGFGFILQLPYIHHQSTHPSTPTNIYNNITTSNNGIPIR